MKTKIALLLLLLVAGCNQLTVTDRIAIAEAAADANELAVRAHAADCADPNTCEWMKNAVTECATSLALVDRIANGGD